MKFADFDVSFEPPDGIPIRLTPADEGDWTVTAQKDDDILVHVRAGATADKLRATPIDARGTIHDGKTEVKVRVRSVEPLRDGGVKVAYERLSFPYSVKA
ncbi:hypothetical protein [Methylobacterium sp. 1973]|uniref:hypothetical protein n=1 Tax=Methylobacterium sp. 1973 TaxID=3156421 RepID=UPI0033956979